jgi:hypothetical protein
LKRLAVLLEDAFGYDLAQFLGSLFFPVPRKLSRILALEHLGGTLSLV